MAELSLVASTREAPARRLAEAHGARAYSTDVDAVVADPDIDALSICTPSGAHAELAVAALEAGKHVMIEKPIDVSLGAADRIIAAESASGRKVGVVSQHRFDRATERVMAASPAASWGVSRRESRRVRGGGRRPTTTVGAGAGHGPWMAAARS